MRGSLLLSTLSAIGLLIAGCIQNPPAPTDDGDVVTSDVSFEPVVPPVPDFDFSTVVDPDHGGHEIPALHTIGHGLDLVAHTGVGSILPQGMRGSITQIDVWQGYAAVAGFEDGPAFILLDVTDPTSPKPISYAPTIADGWTVRFTDDGNYLFYGCQTGIGANGLVRGTCSDPTAVHAPPPEAGISVYNVSDKAKPKFVHFLPVAGSHNIQQANIDGVDYVCTASTAILKLDRAAGKLKKMAEVPGTHDCTFLKHPLTQDWLLITGAKELAIYNVNDPSDPQEVLAAGDWKDGTGWHEQTAFPLLIEGRALLALAGESFLGAAPTGIDAVTIVDITDPAAPKKLGAWSPPFNPTGPWVSYTFSVHEMTSTPQGQLSIGFYHGGVWVIDVSTTERQADPVTIAAYQPNEDINVTPATFAQTPVPMVPFVWGAAWDARGYLIVPDMHTGVYVLEPEWGLHPVIDSGA